MNMKSDKSRESVIPTMDSEEVVKILQFRRNSSRKQSIVGNTEKFVLDDDKIGVSFKSYALENKLCFTDHFTRTSGSYH